VERILTILFWKILKVILTLTTLFINIFVVLHVDTNYVSPPKGLFV